MKQREADARLLGQRAALRVQRAAELADAEAQARARAVEFEGPVMRALMQDKVRTHTTRDWPSPLPAVLSVQDVTQADAPRDCHTGPAIAYVDQKHTANSLVTRQYALSRHNDPCPACCRSAHGSWQTETQIRGTTRTYPQRKRAGRGTSWTRRLRRRQQRCLPSQAAAASAPQRAPRRARPAGQGHRAAGRRLQARRSRRPPQPRL